MPSEGFDSPEDNSALGHYRPHLLLGVTKVCLIKKEDKMMDQSIKRSEPFLRILSELRVR